MCRSIGLPAPETDPAVARPLLSSQPTGPASQVAQRGWSAAVVGGSVLWLLVRVIVSAISLLVLRLTDGASLTDRAGRAAPGNGGTGFFAVLHHWDSNFFLSIASDGYFSKSAPPGMAGFFPGYPMVGRWLDWLLTLGEPTNTSLAVSLWLISAASSLITAVVFWRLVEVIQPNGVAALTTFLLLAGPYSVFLYANYSEGLFLVFAVAGWYCAAQDRWWLAGGWCAMATATRINGCFLVAALVVMYVLRRRRDGRALLAPSSGWILVAWAGVLAYFSYLAVRTGDVFAWNTAQAQGWGRGLRWPWEAFYQTAGRALYASTVDRRLQFALDILFAAVISTAVVVWIRRRDWAPAVYAGLTLIALTTSFTFVSLARNSVTLFPLVILLAGTLRGTKRRWARALLIGCWVGLFLLNTTVFAFGYWAD